MSTTIICTPFHETRINTGTVQRTHCASCDACDAYIRVDILKGEALYGLPYNFIAMSIRLLPTYLHLLL